MPETVLKVNSHRASGKLATALGRKPQYSWTFEHGGCFVILTSAEADRVMPITGITRSRVKLTDLAPCL